MVMIDQQCRFLVVGDVMCDVYWHSNVSRISPEAPVPIALLLKEEQRLGGAANVAANLRMFSSNVGVLGYLGNDVAGAWVYDEIDKLQVSNHLIQDPNLSTTRKIRVVDANHQLIRIDVEDKRDPICTANISSKLEEVIGMFDVVVFSDYNKGVLNSIQNLIKVCKDNNKIVIVDPKKCSFNAYQNSFLIKPNLVELQSIIGDFDLDDLESKVCNLLEYHKIKYMLLTMGANGMRLYSKNGLMFSTESKAIDVFDVTGAGDTVLATLAYCIGTGSSVQKAVEISNRAASIVVSKFGTSTVPWNFVEMVSSELVNENELFHNDDEYPELIATARSQGKKIVMTNGCFDILHAGHVQLLSEAKSKGDFLIVAINSDSSVKSIKGVNRPINNIKYRKKILESLRSVDMVIVFDEDTPQRLYNEIIPDILVKGADYSDKTIIGADTVLAHGGKVELIELVPEISTTSLIKRMGYLS